MKRLNYILFLPILVLGLESCVLGGNERVEINELLTLANEKHNEGRFKESIRILTEVIERDPDNVLVHFNRAASKSAIKDIEGAIEDCLVVTQLDSDNMKAHFNLAMHYEARRELNKAVEQYNIAENIHFTSSKMKLITHYADGTTDEEPDYYVPIEDVYFYRALVEMKRREFKRAILDLEFCIQMNTFLGISYSKMGECYLELGEKDKACDYFTLSKEKEYQQADSLLNVHCQEN